MKRWSALATGVFLLVCFSGCLISEVTRYSITLNPDGKSGTFRVIMRNIESDSQDSAVQRKDFTTLINQWKGDQYLLDEMEKGMAVKERRLGVERGKLVWRETAVFADINKLIPGFNPNEPLRFPVNDTTRQSITSNGTLVKEGDSLSIVWPPQTRSFEMSSVQKSFTPSSRFRARFQSMKQAR